ncbi:MAG TPA: hypothetical protein VGK33_06735 [Chloroflexota bacterium]
MSGRRVWLVFVALAVLGSQAGHLLVYQLRFGAAAQQVQAAGAHAYFPTLAKTGVGALGAVAIAGVFVVALARVLSGGPLTPDRSMPSYARLVAAMFTIQLAVFTGQELVESAAAGAVQPSLLVLLLWGTLGQLPVAMAAALALRWLMARLGSAITLIRASWVPAPEPDRFFTAGAQVFDPYRATLLLVPVADTPLTRRGPPSSLRLSSR